MKKTTKLFRDGVYIRDIGDSERFIAAPGETLHVSGMMMDSMNPPLNIADSDTTNSLHRPGYGMLADSDRDRKSQSLSDQEQRLNDAWRNPPALANEREQVKPAATNLGARDAVDAAYERRNAVLEGAWR